jgi:hypothetical protein
MSKQSSQPKAKPQSNSIQEMRKSMELKSYPQSWYYVCGLVYLCYCYAAFFPTGAVWGIHFIAYIPSGMKIFLLIVGGLLLVPNIQRSVFLAIADLLGSQKSEQKVRLLPAAMVAGICFLIFRTFNIATDIYGDNIYMLKEYGANSTVDWNWLGDVFNPHWVDNKEALTVGVHRIIAYIFSISIESSYQIMSELCGALFIFIWLWFVQKITIKQDSSSVDNRFLRTLRMILMLLGMFAGADLVFFSHVENYSFSILTYTFFFVALYFYMEGKLGTVAFILIYLLAFKAHLISFLFFPAFLVALAFRYQNKLPKLQSLFTWRAIFRVIIIPTFLAGLALYLFLFQSWKEPYAMSTRQFERSFLPIITFPAPLNHYAIWSPYHIADFFNLLLLIAAPIVVILANVLVFNRKEIIWSQPRVIVFGLAALFPLLFFMSMNPMLSPVRDWDVYTLFFPPLLFFASMLLIQPGVRLYLASWLSQTLVFGVLLTTILVAVNASPNELQSCLLDAGAYTYRSYYGNSDYIEARALSLNDSSKITIDKFSNILEKMSESSTSGTDVELAGMMARLASLYTRAGDDSSAILWASNARRTDTRIHRSVVDLAGYYIQANRLAEGSNTLKEFLKYRTERGDTDNSYLDELAAVMSQLGARYSRTGQDSLTIAWAEYARKIEPLNLKYTYDLVAYYMQTDRPHQALDLLHTIPPDSVSVDGLTTTAVAAANAFGADSGLPYLYKARAMAPNNLSIDSLIMEMKKAEP